MYIKTLFIVLALASLACAQTAQIPTPSATLRRPADSRGAVRQEQTPKPSCLRAQTDLHIRAEPDEKSPVIFWLYEGQQAEVKEITTNWTLVTIDNIKGYVKTRYTERTNCK